jgi:hypothetical protein
LHSCVTWCNKCMPYGLSSWDHSTQHPMTRHHRAFHDQLVKREKFLETVEPLDPGQRHLVPALVGRWLQLRTNLWLQAQSKSAAPITPPDFTALFDQMTLLERWEPRFPACYLEIPGPRDNGLHAPMHPDITPTMLPPPATSETGRGTAPKKPSTIRSNAYNEVFQKFKALGIRTSPLRDHLKEHNIAIAKNSKLQELCLAWHVVGMCNTNCKRSSTHQPLSSEDTDALLAWCDAHYNLSA